MVPKIKSSESIKAIMYNEHPKMKKDARLKAFFFVPALVNNQLNSSLNSTHHCGRKLTQKNAASERIVGGRRDFLVKLEPEKKA